MRGILHALAGRIGRRYWFERFDRAMGRAREQGLIDSWFRHEVDARFKGYGGVAADKRYPLSGEAPANPQGAESSRGGGRDGL